MKKKFLVLLLTLTMILSFSPYVAKAADTDDTDSSNKTDTIDGRTYFYDQFDNSAYRTVYKQINDAIQRVDIQCFLSGRRILHSIYIVGQQQRLGSYRKRWNGSDRQRCTRRSS